MQKTRSVYLFLIKLGCWMLRATALSDSNTSPRVTVSVWGHVVASQTCIVQVPYATVTGKYVRALHNEYVGHLDIIRNMLGTSK